MSTNEWTKTFHDLRTIEIVYIFRAEEDSLSTGSNATVTPQERSTPSSPQNRAPGDTTSVKTVTPSTPQVAILRQLSRSSTTTSDKDNSTEKDVVNGVVSKDAVRRHSNVSNVTMTHVSVMSELCSKSDPVQYLFLFS